MRFNLYLESFRCFSYVGPLRIAPITLLVGENSSGKTSFLAALRQVVDNFVRNPAGGFNKEPYYLGSFEQIAHYRGGRSGRAKSFKLISELLPDDEQTELFSTRRSPATARMEFEYVKGAGQPEVSRYRFSARGIAADFNLAGLKPRISVERAGQPLIMIDPERAPASLALRREASFLTYYLQDLMFAGRLGSNDNGEEASAVRALSSALRSATRTMRRSVFASAPVRIQPRRVYIPSELSSGNAGEQVPLEMANLKLTAPARWLETRQRLSEFGRRSGLFEDVDVKVLGKTDSDPFQIQIKHQGPASNIVDVGYGVSQALPLLYPLQPDSGFDFFLLQQPEVHLHPKAQAEFGSLITGLSASQPGKNYVIETHSDFVIDRIRSDVREGVIRPTDVSILLFRRCGLDVKIENMGVSASGDLVGQPDDYREFFLREQARVLGV